MRSAIIVLLAASVVTAGCTTSAIDVHSSRMAEFTPGASSYSGIIAALGPPKVDQADADGTRAVIYDYTSVSKLPDDIDPAFPWRKRGANVRPISVLLVFERDGTLRSWRSDATGRGS
jgi:hypothetical protein